MFGMGKRVQKNSRPIQLHCRDKSSKSKSLLRCHPACYKNTHSCVPSYTSFGNEVCSPSRILIKWSSARPQKSIHKRLPYCNPTTCSSLWFPHESYLLFLIGFYHFNTIMQWCQYFFKIHNLQTICTYFFPLFNTFLAQILSRMQK